MKELDQAQDRALQIEKLGCLGQVTATVAHELRQPLTVIKNAAYYLNLRLKDKDEEERVKRHLALLDQEANRASRVIADLLDFAHPHSPLVQAAELPSVMETALALSSLPEHIRVEVQWRDGLAQLRADPHQLAQAFTNLIVNAAQAMPQGGVLIIEGATNGVKTEVFFRDNGAGIAEADLDKIFEPFFTTKAKGVGLGLTVAQRVIEAHGGTISAASRVGEGVTFAITLPQGGSDVREAKAAHRRR